jgi:hypothetical protein
MLQNMSMKIQQCFGVPDRIRIVDEQRSVRERDRRVYNIEETTMRSRWRWWSGGGVRWSIGGGVGADGIGFRCGALGVCPLYIAGQRPPLPKPTRGD